VQGNSAPGVFRASGSWRAVADHPDLAGRDRYLTALRI
jgi:release factor glutamine methyltransferase